LYLVTTSQSAMRDLFAMKHDRAGICRFCLQSLQPVCADVGLAAEMSATSLWPAEGHARGAADRQRSDQQHSQFAEPQWRGVR
jgi:hypothetical protein